MQSFFYILSLVISLQGNPEDGLSFNPQETVKIYPNPATEVVYVDIEKPSAQLTIYSLIGTKIKTISLSQGKNAIMTSELGVDHSGIYLFKVIQGKQKNVQKVLIR